MVSYRICIESYGGPMGYCDTELLYTKWKTTITKAIDSVKRRNKPHYERSAKYFLEMRTSPTALTYTRINQIFID